MSNFQRCLLLICLTIALALSAGCGGGGESEAPATIPNGVYSCGYNRVDGTVNVLISGASVQVQVTDGTDIYIGSGTMANGRFVVDCTTGAKAVRVTGDVIQLHNQTFQIFIGITGEFTAGGTAVFQATTLAGIYAGHYAGGNSGQMTGSFTLDVNDNGTMSLTTHLNNKTYQLAGTLANGFAPQMTFDIEPGGSVLYQPRFSAMGATKQVSGEWVLSNWDNEGSNALGTFQGSVSTGG